MKKRVTYQGKRWAGRDLSLAAEPESGNRDDRVKVKKGEMFEIVGKEQRYPGRTVTINWYQLRLDNGATGWTTEIHIKEFTCAEDAHRKK